MRKIALLIFACTLALPVFAQDKPASKPVSPTRPSEQPAEIAIPAGFEDSFGALRAMDAQRVELQNEINALQNLEQKKQQELISLIPQGYSYDPAKKMFVKNPEPPAAEKK